MRIQGRTLHPATLSERSSRAACLLGQTVRWTEVGAVLDVDVLLRDVIADRQKKYIAFRWAEQAAVAVRRETLAAVAPLRRNVLDLVAFVNDDGVHFRCGYLAAAGLVSMAAGTAAQAEKLANTAEALWASNEGAANSPVTDDQLIELVLLFEMWAAVGNGDAIRRAALGTINRHAARFAFGYPLPSSSHRARVPMRPTTVAALVTAHFSGDGGDSVFADRGSTLLPALVYSAHRLGSSPPTDALLPLMKSDPPLAMQIWQPPGDAGQRWYLKELDDGTAVTLTHLGSDLGKVVAEFERVARIEIAASAADRLGVPAVDRLAWKLTRTPPPMKVLAELLDRVVSPPAKTKAPKRPRGSRASGK